LTHLLSDHLLHYLLSLSFLSCKYTEARYHYVVERTALREDSEAWKRAQEMDIAIPQEMLGWVGNELKQESSSNLNSNNTNSSSVELEPLQA